MIWITFGNNSLETTWLIEDILKQKLPGGGNFLLRFFIVTISLNLCHVTGMLSIFSCFLCFHAENSHI